MGKIKKEKVTTISEIVNYISKIKIKNNTILAYRGEKKDYSKSNTELVPSVYRNNNYLENEDIIFRESQRFNNQEFLEDRTSFDKLSRIQHYSAPTRLLDISEDLISALYFAIGEKEDYEEDSILYIFELKTNKIKYYDSDTVSVISNLAKIPLKNNKNNKSKETLLCDVKQCRNNVIKFNKRYSTKFLIHEIKEEKPQFSSIIKPKHLISVQCVKPKLTSDRIKSQKGFFLLFGLNPDDVRKPIKLITEDDKLNKKINHPIKKIHKIVIKSCNIKEMKEQLQKMGIKKPFIYPEIDKISEYLTKQFSLIN